MNNLQSIRHLTTAVIIVSILSFTTGLSADGDSGSARLHLIGLQPGEKLPAGLSVYDRDKNKVPLNSLYRKDFTVITLGCLTCPGFYRSYQGIEAVYADYKNNASVDFYYLYKRLAHPENHGYVEAFTMEERFAHIEEAKRTLQTTIPWLAAPMSNEIETALKDMPNLDLIFNRAGNLVYISEWSNGDKLRAKLAVLVGPVDNPTTVDDLDMPEINMITERSSGVVPKLQFTETLIPIVIDPKIGDRPFFVKLRAEADRSLLQTGSGRLYLGFHLDPIHKVHWNNLAAPLKYTLKAAASMEFTPASAAAPEIKSTASDIDPREFLVNVDGWKAGESIRLQADYYACDDQDRWCYPVSEQYEITLAKDPRAGGTIGRSFERPKKPPPM